MEQRCFGIAGRIISYAVAGHHAGLPDFQSEGASGKRSSLLLRLKKQVPSVDPPVEIGSPALVSAIKLPEWIEQCHGSGFSTCFAIRMIFSCLVDADFLDTEAFCASERHDRRGRFPSIDALRMLIEEKAASFSTADNRYDEVNRVRREVSEACRRAAAKVPGFFSLTVPTGGGKTLSSVRFALNHAVQHGKRRVIYAIPYTTIIEQTTGVFRETFGDESVVEHHSRVEVNEDHETLRTRLAAENWDAPLIVTTNVQLFESLFAARGSRCRKLHNIADSVIVLDEAQMLPVSLLIPTLNALRELVERYGCSIVLCTATQPALRRGPQLPQGLIGVREIIPEPRSHFDHLQRVKFHYLGGLTNEDLADRLAGEDQVLCVMNTRRNAQEIYRLLVEREGSEGCFYLSTYLCPAHRDVVFAAVRERLKRGLTCRVVSTQLIEAGVHISFPAVFRAVAGLDSVLQAGGRCNRDGEMDGLGQVFIFIEENPPKKGFLERTAKIGRSIIESGEDIGDPALIERYFTELYAVTGGGAGADGLDEKRIIKDFMDAETTNHFRFQFSEIENQYRLIEQHDIPIVVRYRRACGTEADTKTDVRQLIEELQYTQSRGVLRKLQPFIVNVPKRVHSEMARRGDIVSVGELIYLLERTDLYDEQGAGFRIREFGDFDASALVH